MSRAHVERLLVDAAPLGGFLGVGGFEGEGEGVWSLVVDEATTLFVDLDEPRDCLVISADVGTPQPADRASWLELLLCYNGQWHRTGGVRMALEASDGPVVQLADLPLAGLDAHRLHRTLASFVEILATWRQVLPGRATQAAEAVAPQSNSASRLKGGEGSPMPQLDVTGGVGFSRIYARFQPTGRASDDKHVRFQEAKGLYTSQTLSLAKLSALFGSDRLEQRAAKRAEGGQEIRNAIMREHPQLADRIFARLGETHPQIDFDRGVRRSDLEAIRQTIDEVRLGDEHLASVTPTALGLHSAPDAPGRLVGDAEGSYSQAGIESVLTYVSDSLDIFNDPTKHPPIEREGLPPVINQFMIDIDRAQVRLGDGESGETLRVDGERDPREALRAFTGSDRACLNLSKLMNQNALTGLLMGATTTFVGPDGTELMPRVAGRLPDKDTIHSITARREGDVYRIDYATQARISGFTPEGGARWSELDKGASEMHLAMQLEISAEDLEQGNFAALRMTGPPTFRLHAEVDTADLHLKALEQG